MPKRKGAFFKPHFPRQSVNCSGQDNRGCCKHRLQKKSRRTLDIPCKQEVESFDEALWQMTPVGAALICSKECDGRRCV